MSIREDASKMMGKKSFRFGQQSSSYHIRDPALPSEHLDGVQRISAVSKEEMRGLAEWFQKEYEKSNSCIAVEQNEWAEELVCIRDAGATSPFQGVGAKQEEGQYEQPHEWDWIQYQRNNRFLFFPEKDQYPLYMMDEDAF